MRKRLFMALCFVGCLFLCSSPAFSEPLAIFVNVHNPVEKLTVDAVRKIYQDEMTRWPDGNRVTAYDLPLKSRFRAIFSEKVIHKPAEKVEEDWANKRITNTAKNPTVVLKNDMLVIIKVSNDPDAIGYLPISMLKDEKEIRIILTLE
ncbi:MAG: substrate-binding domain-containing protein [Deltaproteobacteria bacterium]|nr:substrate-binding domain-containing protein [Deltaproteobacteria bacterium]